MITLFLLTSAIYSITTGRTSPITPAHFPSFLPEHRAVEDPSQCFCPNTRSILSIVWSCLSTIFLCTWVTIHPNVPPTDKLGFIKFLRRLKLLFVALLAPELIVAFAFFQRGTAYKESKKYRSRGWTMAHGHFLIMGGFVLMKGEEDMGTLSCELLEQLDKDGDIEFPAITREQIEDRSKADVLSKVIVIFQTFWFIISCIVRYTQGLDVMQIEVVTLAYCSQSAVIYSLWWSKPLDVQTTTPVYLKAGSDYVHKPELRRAEVIEDNYGTNRDVNEALGVDGQAGQRTSRILKYWSTFSKVLMKSRYNNLIVIDLTPDGVPKRWVERDRTEGVLPTVFQCVVTLFSVIYAMAVFLIFLPSRLLEDVLDDHPQPPGQNGVHTFYHSVLDDITDRDRETIMHNLAITSGSFGWLHLIFVFKPYFPTTTDTVMWRSSSILLVVFPLFVLLMSITAKSIDGWVENLEHKVNLSRCRRYSICIACFIGKTISSILMACFVLSFTVYIIARFMLLTLCATSLRNPAPTALLDVSWSNFVPHI